MERRVFLERRVSGMGEALKIGITGLPGAGKTYCLLKVIEMLEADGLKVGGMITEPIVKRNRREGFYVMDWATREKRVFASREIASKTMVGRFGVDISALEEVGVNALRSATANADVIVIDEVGKMEVESPNFVQTVKDALDADKPLLLTLHKKSRNPLLQDIRRRDDVRILEVTMVNRNLLPYKIVKLMKGEVL
ncbi:MAG TPA: NTPase [Thermoplasmata archaeon]|nr:NTPase [Thermoplasmata archaeon]